jgi:hypothetical protein
MSFSAHNFTISQNHGSDYRPTPNGWLHERFRVRFHVRFAAYRRCDLVYLRFAVRQESLSNFFLHQIADAIWCAILCTHWAPLRTISQFPQSHGTDHCPTRERDSKALKMVHSTASFWEMLNQMSMHWRLQGCQKKDFYRSTFAFPAKQSKTPPQDIWSRPPVSNPHLSLGAGYTSDLMRAICCKSHMRFAVSAIWCPTRITSYLFFCTKSQMPLSVSAIWCAIPRPCLSFTTRNRAPNRTANRTANCNTISQHHIACYV